jgi:hypothetical protein
VSILPLINYYFHILMNYKIYMLFYKFEPTVCWIYMFLMIWVLLSILKIWWCFEVWIWYMELEWIVWLYDVVGNFVDYDCNVNERDFEWVIKLEIWRIACLRAQLGYLRTYEHNLVTCICIHILWCDGMCCMSYIL